MPPELTLGLLAIATAGSAGIAKLITAMVDRRVKKMNEDAEELRKEREQKRNREMEEMRQKTATAQAAAEQAQAVGENLINLNSTIIKLIENHTAVSHAQQAEMSNQAQSIGDMGESLDRVATAVDQNTTVTRATGSKADTVVIVVNELKSLMETSNHTLNTGINRIIDLLKDDEDSQQLRPVA